MQVEGMKIFISGVQKELAAERKAVARFLAGDPLLRRFFECFLFEEQPAADQRADQCYLDEVDGSDLYLGIFGHEYGREDAEGLSATHREFNRATEKGKTRLIYVKGADDSLRHPKMQALVEDAAGSLIRRRFNSPEEIVAAVYASLVRILEERELIRFGPFDASFCRNATLDDLDSDRINRFLVLARRGRNFPLPDVTPPHEVLEHLNLLDKGRPTNAAILLFGRRPQRFLITSEVKCAHFHGFEVEKPIPSYQVYKGTVFDLVDQAKDFVLSKIDLWVGTRAESTQVPTKYEIPQEVVAEAIVNAVVHRDYTSNASVQVMLFKDRLEVWNPGILPPTLTLEKLRGPHASVPHNPLIAEPMYLTKYIERMGTGVRDMIRRCLDAGLAEPEIRIDGGFFVLTIRRNRAWLEGAPGLGQDRVGAVSIPGGEHIAGQVAGQVTGQVAGQVDAWIVRVLSACTVRPLSSREIQEAAGLRHRETFQRNYLDQIINDGLVERTVPDKPTSRLQKYRLTEKGRKLLESAGVKVRRS
jgi:predicted HTH transcriptional regulator